MESDYCRRVRERIEEEKCIRSNGETEAKNRATWAVAASLARIMAERGIPHWVSGTAGGSLLAKELNITGTDPMPPYYLCETCGHTEWVSDQTYASGFDLPRKNCPCCGNGMKRDGQNLSGDLFYGLEGEKRISFEIRVPHSFLADLQKYRNSLAEEPEKKEPVRVTLRGSDMLEQLVHRRQLYQKEKKIGMPTGDRDIGDMDIPVFFMSKAFEDMLGYSSGEASILQRVKGQADLRPRCFSDLIRIAGLLHGTGVWENNADNLLKDGHTLRELILFREDLMKNLTDHGINRREAYELTEQIGKKSMRRKDLSAEQVALLREHQIPEWQIESMQKIEYLFPRAHEVEWVTAALKLYQYQQSRL